MCDKTREKSSEMSVLSTVMSGILAFGFGAFRASLSIFLVLFVMNGAGYFIGEWAHNTVLALKEGNALGLVLSQSTRSLGAKAIWGLCYGLGFGAGIGFAFYFCQTEARRLIAATEERHTGR